MICKNFPNTPITQGAAKLMTITITRARKGKKKPPQRGGFVKVNELSVKEVNSKFRQLAFPFFFLPGSPANPVPGQTTLQTTSNCT